MQDVSVDEMEIRSKYEHGALDQVSSSSLSNPSSLIISLAQLRVDQLKVSKAPAPMWAAAHNCVCHAGVSKVEESIRFWQEGRVGGSGCGLAQLPLMDYTSGNCSFANSGVLPRLIISEIMFSITWATLYPLRGGLSMTGNFIPVVDTADVVKIYRGFLLLVSPRGRLGRRLRHRVGYTDCPDVHLNRLS